MTKPLLPQEDPPDLWPEIERRLAQSRPDMRRGGRAAVAAVALVVFAASSVVLWRAFTPAVPERVPVAGPPDGIAEGWTRLSDPPDVRPGASYVWTGTEVLAWGGCDPSVHDDCVRARDGYALDPASGRWSSIPPAPVGGEYARAIWTGEEAVFLSTAFDERVEGVAYGPATRAWRTVSDAPIEPRFGVVTVWTGSRILVWGGGERSDPATDGALYDPATDGWTLMAPAPLGLNQASGLWTGSEVIVFGSLLDNRNHAETDTSVGAAYDPATDTWRSLPPSELSPQAASAVWAGDRMVAWDYETYSQEYDPASDMWSQRIKMPLDSSECYPDSLALADVVFAFFCGRAALYDTATGTWLEIHGGLLDEDIWSDAYERQLKLWRFADLVPAGDVAFLVGEGITINDKGVACYGCPGSPTSLWAYRLPAATPSPPASELETGEVVYHVPLLAAAEGWFVHRSDPVRTGDATYAWASTVPNERDDIAVGAAITPKTIGGLPLDGIVITALATAWSYDPSLGPYPNGLGPFDLSTAEVRRPVAEEPPGNHAVYEMNRHGVLIRVYFGTHRRLRHSSRRLNGNSTRFRCRRSRPWRRTPGPSAPDRARCAAHPA
ncbi:MAG: hypothetical protein ACRDHS_07025 [Actinomycetota bacterium]